MAAIGMALSSACGNVQRSLLVLERGVDLARFRELSEREQ